MLFICEVAATHLRFKIVVNLRESGNSFKTFEKEIFTGGHFWTRWRSQVELGLRLLTWWDVAPVGNFLAYLVREGFPNQNPNLRWIYPRRASASHFAIFAIYILTTLRLVVQYTGRMPLSFLHFSPWLLRSSWFSPRWPWPWLWSFVLILISAEQVVVTVIMILRNKSKIPSRRSPLCQGWRTLRTRSKYYFGIEETSKGALVLSLNFEPQIEKQEECLLSTQSSLGGGAGPDDLGLKGLARAGQVLGGATQQAA